MCMVCCVFVAHTSSSVIKMMGPLPYREKYHHFAFCTGQRKQDMFLFYIGQLEYAYKYAIMHNRRNPIKYNLTDPNSALFVSFVVCFLMTSSAASKAAPANDPAAGSIFVLSGTHRCEKSYSNPDVCMHEKYLRL